MEIDQKDNDRTNFRLLPPNDRTQRLKEIITLYTKQQTQCKVEIFKPRGNGKHFEPLALLTFSSTSDRYTFESAFASGKRANPREKLSISRPTTEKGRGDDSIPKVEKV